MKETSMKAFLLIALAYQSQPVHHQQISYLRCNMSKIVQMVSVERKLLKFNGERCEWTDTTVAYAMGIGIY